MIFVTVGTQLPFDRLIRAVDALAPCLPQPIHAQIGKTNYRPTNLRCYEWLSPQEFDLHMHQANVVVSHAGIGTVLLAKKNRKPIILVPRRSQLSEHRNDHQLATANQLRNHKGVYVAWDETELRSLLCSNIVIPPDDNTTQAGRAHLNEFVRSALSKIKRANSINA